MLSCLLLDSRASILASKAVLTTLAESLHPYDLQMYSALTRYYIHLEVRVHCSELLSNRCVHFFMWWMFLRLQVDLSGVLFGITLCTICWRRCFWKA